MLSGLSVGSAQIQQKSIGAQINNVNNQVADKTGADQLVELGLTMPEESP